MSDPAPPLADEKYISLETFKRDGAGVKTPVWAVAVDGKLYVMSAGSAYKIKRLRRDSHARIAPCDVRGNVRGGWLEGTARIVEDQALVERAHKALRQKYGFLMAMGDFFAGLTGRLAKRAYIEISVPAA